MDSKEATKSITLVKYPMYNSSITMLTIHKINESYELTRVKVTLISFIYRHLLPNVTNPHRTYQPVPTEVYVSDDMQIGNFVLEVSSVHKGTKLYIEQ